VLLRPRAVRILLAAEPVDLRKSIDGLAALVRSGWQENVFAGHLFVFVSRRRDKVKILTWDSGGFIVFYKRLLCGAPHRRRYAGFDVMHGLAGRSVARTLTCARS